MSAGGDRSSLEPGRVADRRGRVGFVGVGAMGSRMVRRLAGRGFLLTVYDSNPDAAHAAEAPPQVTAAGSITDLAGCDPVITMLPDDKAVRSCVLGSDAVEGLAHVLGQGSLVLDMSSSGPQATVDLARVLRERGLRLADAPVSGGVARAEDGTLAIMTGGDEVDLERCRPLLEAMGSHIVHVGGIGAGHAAKALNNMLSASGLVAAIEVLSVGARFGLDPAVLLDVFNNSTGKNNSTEHKIAQQVLSRAFGAGFSMRLMRKDLATAMDLAHQTGTPTPLSAACFEVWEAAMRHLDVEDDVDHTAIARYVEDQAGVTLTPRSGPARH